MLDVSAQEQTEHQRRNAECAERLQVELVRRQRTLLVVSLEPGLHRSRRTGLLCNIRDLPGVELVADGSDLPPSVIGELLKTTRNVQP